MRLSKNWENLPWQWLLPLLFFCIGLIYLYASPHFESPDSKYHNGMIKWIADNNGALPIQSAEHDELYAQEASQPPLYYFMMAPLWAALDTSDFADFYQTNPLAYIGNPARLGNRNVVFYRQPHPPDLRGSSLALYIVRVLSLGMGAVSVFAIYQAARTLLPNRTGIVLLATALAAFNPQFVYISASVTNDNLVIALATLLTWQTLLMLRAGFQTRRNLILALLIALLTLSKLSGWVIVVTTIMAAIWTAYRHRQWRTLIAFGAMLLLLWLALAGWWYARNLALYGELFGTSAMLEHFGKRQVSLGQLVSDEFTGLRFSFWGLFGWFSIFTHNLHYRAMDILSLVGLIGLALHLLKIRRQSQMRDAVIYLIATLALGVLSLIWWTSQTTGSQGRLVFPYLVPFCLLLAMGLSALRIPPLLIALPMLLFSIAAPFLYIIPAYDHPPALDNLPSRATPTFAQWEGVTIVGYELPPPQRWSPGDEVPLTLYWRPLAQSSELQALFITLIDADGNKLATIDSFPGWGTLPPTLWQPDLIYKDDYILQIPPAAQGFSTAQLHIGWYDWDDRIDILPTLDSGEQTAAFILPFGAFVGGSVPRQLDAPATASGTVFGDSIRLNQYRFTQGNLLELEWQIIRPLAGDWRVLAIVFAETYESGKPFEVLLQQDASPPIPLDYLDIDETFITGHDFAPPADYRGEHENLHRLVQRGFIRAARAARRGQHAATAKP